MDSSEGEILCVRLLGVQCQCPSLEEVCKFYFLCIRGHKGKFLTYLSIYFYFSLFFITVFFPV